MRNIFLIVIVFFITTTGCREIFAKRVPGNGNISTENRSGSGITDIHVSGAIKVYLKQDSAEGIRVEADDNLLPYIITEVNGDELDIYTENHYNLRPSRSINVYVSSSAFKNLGASGACNLYSENKLNAPEKLDIHLSGACNAQLDVKSPEIFADISGAGSVELKGETRTLKLEGSGSSDFKCFDLMAENVQVDISGSGDAQVSASVKLDVSVSGAGTVRYKGNPSVSKSISGAGSVKKAD